MPKNTTQPNTAGSLRSPALQTPKLRFPGFEGVWEEKKLEEVAETPLYGMNAAAKEFDGKNIYLRITDIDEKNNKLKKTGLTSPDGLLESQYKLKKGDLLFTRTGASTGKTYLYDELDGDLYFAGFLIKFPIIKADPYFIYLQTLQKEYWKWVKTVSARSGQPGINAKEYSEFKFYIPQLPEQQKIASFLGSVDEWLENLRTQKQNLEQYKKGIMQQIFSQKIRFKDENGNDFPDWEEKKIEDVFQVTRGQVLAVKDMSETKTEEFSFPVYSSQTKNNGLIGYYKDFLFENAITWTTDGANAGDVNFRKGEFYCTNVCGVLVSKEGFANECIAQLLNTIAYKFVSKVGNPKLMNNIMAKIKISFPSLLEQQKIAEFLSSVDDLIESKQQQITQVEEWKKGVMQGLFV